MNNATETKRFTVGQILTVTQGRMLCPVGEIYEILNWMTGESLMTHQLPRASRESEGFLRAQFPELNAVDTSQAVVRDEETARAYLASLESGFGTHRDVRPLPAGDHTFIDPIAEIKMMRPDLPVLAVSENGVEEL